MKPTKAWAVSEVGFGIHKDETRVYDFERHRHLPPSTPMMIFETKKEAERWRKKWKNAGSMRTVPVLITPITPKKKKRV